MANDYFSFKRFTVWQRRAAMRVGTDGVLLGAWFDPGGDGARMLDVGTGTGVIAGGPVRIIMEAAGIKDIRTKCLRSNTAVNVVAATFEGLKALRTPEEVARTRGKSVDEIVG